MATFKKYGCKSEKKQLKLLKVASPREQDKAWEREQELQWMGQEFLGGFMSFLELLDGLILIKIKMTFKKQTLQLNLEKKVIDSTIPRPVKA